MLVTRFAPSPTGRLHLGHAYSAVIGHQWAPSAESTRFANQVMDEDVWAIEHQQRNIDLRPDAPTTAIGSDTAMLAMRKIVQKMLQAESA